MSTPIFCKYSYILRVHDYGYVSFITDFIRSNFYLLLLDTFSNLPFVVVAVSLVLLFLYFIFYYFVCSSSCLFYALRKIPAEVGDSAVVSSIDPDTGVSHNVNSLAYLEVSVSIFSASTYYYFLI